MKKKITIIISTIVLIMIVSAAIISLLVLRKKKADKTVNIAFYGLSENYVNLIKEYIPESEDIILNYSVLAEGKFDAGIVTSKYDMFFTWKGEITDSISDSAEDIPGKILENIPLSLRNKKCLPILLNHYELNFYDEILKNTGVEAYVDYNSFIKYLNEAKAYVFVPFFMAGGDDRELLAFLGSLVESIGGLDSYKAFLSVLKEQNNFDDIINADLGNNFTLKSVLDMLQEWPAQGLTHPSWFSGSSTDVVVFADDNQVGSFFTNLITHRKMAYKTISKYETTAFPRESENVKHGIIAPAICGMLLSNNGNSKKILKDLMTEDIQSVMSDKTMLAPVHYRAETYDRQADDVRFWAASCAGGALPDPALAIYQKNPNSLADIAKEIRTYLKFRKS